MKKHISKILSFFLSLCILFPLCIFANAQEVTGANLEKDTNGNPVIYVSLSGTDVESETMGTKDNPLLTIDAAISLVNALGLKEGDNATVKIITTVETGDKFNYVSYSNSQAHTATITYTSATEDQAYLSCYHVLGSNSESLWVHGPSVFKNLKLIDQRNDGSARSAYLQGHDVTFENVSHYVLKKGTETLNSKNVDLVMGINREAKGNAGNGGKFTVDNGSTLKSVYLGHFTDRSNANLTIANDSTLVVNGGTIPTVAIASMKKGLVTFAKNANIVLNNGAKITKLNGNNSEGGSITVSGAVQVIANYGSTIGTINLSTANSTNYILSVKSNDVALDVTENKGVYSVTGTKIAYIVSADGKTVYYSTNGTLSTVKGTHNVYSADSVDEIVSTLTNPVPEAGYSFEGWDTSKAGIITAKMVYDGSAAVTPKYYVQHNGKGNGLSPEAPVATVADAIALINAAGFEAEDTVEIYIMNDTSLPKDKIVTVDGVTYSDFYWYDIDGNFVKDVKMHENGSAKNIKGRFTPWALENKTAPAHTATIVVKGYTEDAYLAYSQIIGYNSNITITGPTIFEDIKIVANRKNDREVFINANNVTFNNTSFYYLSADNSAKCSGYTGIVAGHQRVCLTSSSADKTITKDFTVIVNSTVASESDSRYGYQIPGAKAATFNGNVKLYFNGKNSKKGAIAWGQSASTFNNGLSIIVNGGEYLAKLRDTVNELTVNGGLQLIANNGCALMPIPSCVNADKVWKMSSAAEEGSSLDVTEKAGTFKVNGEKTAVATNENGFNFYSENGILSVPEGTYTVAYTDAAAEEGTLFLDGEKYCTFIKGSAVKLPTPNQKPGVVFVGWELDGDIFTTYYQTDEDDTVVNLTSQYDVLPDTCVYYVDQTNGNDENGGTSPDKAVADINAAITLADNNSASNKLVVIIGAYYFNKSLTFSAHSSMVTITGDYSGNSVIEKGENIIINGPTTFENIKFVNYVNSKFIDSRSNKLVIGENVTFTAGTKDGKTFSNSFDLHIGACNVTTTVRENAEILSPVGIVYVGAFYNNKEKSFPGGDILITATVNTLKLSADGWSSGTNNYTLPSIYDGVTNITVEGDGVISSITFEASRAVYNENTGFHFIVNNASTPAIPVTLSDYAWVVKTSGATDSDYITGTASKGVFTVHGDKIALAVSSDGKQFVSKNGTLTLPEVGQYTVTFEESVIYTNSGTRVDFYENATIDISTITPSEIDGKYFIGWLDEEGNAPADNAFEVGDVLIAQYIDLDLDSEFFVEGAQIRRSNVADLRFIINKKDSVDEKLPNVKSYGSVVLPYYYLYDYSKLTEYPLELDTTYTSDGKIYTSKDVPALKLYERNDDGVKYTVCITSVVKKYYERMYAVRGYIKYTDLNGFDKVLYTDLYATRNVNIAEAIIREADEGKATLSASERKYYQGIIDTTKELIAQDYSGNHVTIDGDPNAENSFTHVYQIEGTTIQVRDVNVYPNDYVDGETAREPVVVVQTSDLHFNYVSAADFKEANPSIMSTYLGRTAFRNTVPAAVKSLRYAYTADAMVTTGDIIDFLSLGSIELTEKYVFRTYPFSLVSMGNHEKTRVCQQPENAKAPDPTTLESRHEILQDVWNSDIFYASQIVEDRVMIVQLDNGSSTFWDEQIDKFEADLNKARENGYTVLVFFHIPLATGNPNETAIDQLPNKSGRSDNSGVRDFTKEGIRETSNEANAAIFRLLKENGDIVKGIFTGHTHSPYYSELPVEYEEGTTNVTKFIPQYTMTGTAYSGNATRIIIH